MRTFGLIGYPLEHSFSPAYFKEKFAQEGIGARYKLFPLKHISELPDLVHQYPCLEGLNVTIPYKKKVISYLSEIGGVAREIQSVNTLLIQRRPELHLTGHNTDVTGFKKSLENHLKAPVDHALILGTGGTAQTVSYVLKQKGIPFLFVSRSCKENQTSCISYEELFSLRMEDYPLIINTTPLGMYPETDTFPDIPYLSLTPKHLLFDVIYNPGETRFLQYGREAGASTVNGTEMLQYQAEESWRLWNTF